MALTKALNSKANIKQNSAADFPVVPKQPVVARYAAESTLNQTTINLPFQVDTVNAADSFLLSVDGKLLTPGSLNDYTFAAIDSFGFSSAITLAVALPALLNIQGIKLGLKKETEFLQDARFTQVYESQDQAFQGFVRTSDLMVATASVGTPGSGQFYSTIQNRAAMPDLRTDLKARMGIERVMTQSLVQLQNEFGPNGEPVFGVVNDQIGQIRYVGSSWASAPDSSGSVVSVSTVGNYVEVTFYGTGINFLTWMSFTGTASQFVVGVDGGSFGSNIIPTALSNILSNRNYASNIIIPAASGLALGVHTVRIQLSVAGSANSARTYGFEILSESSSIRVQPGTSYIGGKKVTTLAQQTLAYNSSFESGTLGTRGGRVLVYQKSDGSVAKAVQPVDAAQANFTSADHTNEEIARTYNFREFGAGRTDDFSLLSTTAGAGAFTLDDGTTTLVANNSFVQESLYGQGLVYTAASDFISLTFVGTGLDIYNTRNDGVTLGSLTITVDGTSIGNLPADTNIRVKNVKIVSGLPYGTHTVKITFNSGNTYGIGRFIVYQPKKPTLPSGAVELADYNIMADYSSSLMVGTALVDILQMPSGVLTKQVTREFSYIGANFVAFSMDVAQYQLGGYNTGTLTNNSQPIELTFFGTGFVLLFLSHSGLTYDFTVSVDGSLNASGVAKSLATNLGSGSYRASSAGSNQPVRIEFTGLSLGQHKFSISRSGGSGNFACAGVHIITPIHSPKSNLFTDLQNTLPVGSSAISDNRKTSAIKDAGLQTRAVSRALGLVAPSTTSTVFVPMTDMSLTHKNTTGKVRLSFSGYAGASTGGSGYISFYVNGVAVGPFVGYENGPAAGLNVPITNHDVINVPVGVNKFDVYFRAGGGTFSVTLSKVFTVEEI